MLFVGLSTATASIEGGPEEQLQFLKKGEYSN